MIEIPSDQDGWVSDVDHKDVYESAGLDTGGENENESARSLARRLLDKLR